MASGFVIVSDTLTPNLATIPERIDAYVGVTADYFSTRAEGEARTNAPWVDRTGNARNGLHAEAFHNYGTSHGFDLSHSMPYGIFLESRWEGRYAIILPTIEKIGKEAMTFLRALFRAL